MSNSTTTTTLITPRVGSGACQRKTWCAVNTGAEDTDEQPYSQFPDLTGYRLFSRYLFQLRQRWLRPRGCTVPLTGRPRPILNSVCPLELEAPWEEVGMSFLLDVGRDLEGGSMLRGVEITGVCFHHPRHGAGSAPSWVQSRSEPMPARFGMVRGLK